MGDAVFYNIWNKPAGRWTNGYHFTKGHQDHHCPWKLSLAEAQKWLRGSFFLNSDAFEVRPLQSQEEQQEQQRRQAHADKYL